MFYTGGEGNQPPLPIMRASVVRMAGHGPQSILPFHHSLTNLSIGLHKDPAIERWAGASNLLAILIRLPGTTTSSVQVDSQKHIVRTDLRRPFPLRPLLSRVLYKGISALRDGWMLLTMTGFS